MNINIFQELPRLRSRFGRCAATGRKPRNNRSPLQSPRSIAPQGPDKPGFVWDCKGKNLFHSRKIYFQLFSRQNHQPNTTQTPAGKSIENLKEQPPLPKRDAKVTTFSFNANTDGKNIDNFLQKANPQCL